MSSTCAFAIAQQNGLVPNCFRLIASKPEVFPSEYSRQRIDSYRDWPEAVLGACPSAFNENRYTARVQQFLCESGSDLGPVSRSKNSLEDQERAVSTVEIQ